MTCSKCGTAVSIVESTPHNGQGTFQEKYRCANNHMGFISGDESESPNQWERYGEVFQ